LSTVYYIRFIRMLIFTDKFSYSGILPAVNSLSGLLLVVFFGVLQFYLILHQLEIYEYLYYIILERDFIFFSSKL
jgi:hypothetical protein